MRYPDIIYTSPEQFTLKQRIILRIGAPILANLYHVLCRSCRYRVEGEQYRQDVLNEYGHALMAFWHESLGLAAFHYRNTGAHTLTSYSFDGELAARVVNCFGIEAVRGSSSRGGLKALLHLARAVDRVPLVGFTLDGPKGPRRKCKPGIAILSQKTGIPVIPNAFAVRRAWRLNSWDRFVIPRPFSEIVVAYGPPVLPPATRSPESLEEKRIEIEQAMNTLYEELENRLLEE